MCRASSALRELAFTDCSESAGWRNTRFSHEYWRRYMSTFGYSIPILLLLVIGLRLECISVDSLHALDLGFACHIQGNTLWELVQRHAFGKPNQDENVQELEKEMKAWCKTHRVPSRIQGGLTKERIRATTNATGYPKLKAKGAQCRYLAPFTLELAKRFARTAPAYATHDNLVTAVNGLLCSLYEIFSQSGRWLSDAAKLKIVKIGNQLPFFYMKLQAEAHRLGVKLWKMTPKIHMVQELLIFQALLWGNPSYYWTYGDEDLVGTMVEIAHSCHLATVTVTALVKWLVVCFAEVDDDQ